MDRLNLRVDGVDPSSGGDLVSCSFFVNGQKAGDLRLRVGEYQTFAVMLSFGAERVRATAEHDDRVFRRWVNERVISEMTARGSARDEAVLALVGQGDAATRLPRIRKTASDTEARAVVWTCFCAAWRAENPLDSLSRKFCNEVLDEAISLLEPR